MTHFSLCRCLLLAGLLLMIGSTTASAADPTGTWQWTFERPQGEVEVNLDLKAEGQKLTGKVYAGERETEISDGTFKNDNVSFKTVRERDGRKFTMTYQGKVVGDTITGTVEFQIEDRTNSRPWEAKRKEKK